MITGLFKEAASWFISLAEVGIAIAAMLLIGLVVGVTGFWTLSRCLSKLGGPPSELDPAEDEWEDRVGIKVVSICPDEDSPRSKLGA